jgi:hypothetical protein
MFFESQRVPENGLEFRLLLELRSPSLHPGFYSTIPHAPNVLAPLGYNFKQDWSLAVAVRGMATLFVVGGRWPDECPQGRGTDTYSAVSQPLSLISFLFLHPMIRLAYASLFIRTRILGRWPDECPQGKGN